MVDTLRQRRARVAAALAWWPEWPFAIVVVLAWAILLARVGLSTVSPATDFDRLGPRGIAHDHGGHQAHLRSEPVVPPDPLHGSGGAMDSLVDWGLMSVGMMLPVALPAVGHVAVNSLRRRRPRAMTLFVAAYIGIWIGFGIPVLAAAHWLREATALDGRVLLAAALVIAAAWQLTRYKRRALFQCKQTVPLPPIGLPADAACLRFGALQGWRCLRSCWALMVVMALVHHDGFAMMAAMTTLIVTEELTRVGRRLLRPSAGVLALAAGLVVLAT